MGEAHPGTEQHREPFGEGSLHAFGATSILVDRGGEEHGKEVDIGAPGDSVAAGDAAVEIGAVQLRSNSPASISAAAVGTPWYSGCRFARSASGRM